MKQLVAPKPPHRILNEMVGGGVKFEYTENPPLPPGMFLDEGMNLHTLLTEVEGDTSTGTGPTHEIAKNICAEHAIQGVVSRRYAAINSGASKDGKNREEMLLEDETPFELASIAIFKMLNEWEAGGFELPQAISDVLYSQQMFVPVKQRLAWIRYARPSIHQRNQMLNYTIQGLQYGILHSHCWWSEHSRQEEADDDANHWQH